MRKMKYVIGIFLLFMVIGFATVTVSLSLSGNARLTGDIGDFKVYFSDVKMNDEQNLRLVKSETEIMFDVLLQEIGTTYKISYDVTNASSMFDANLSVSCTQGDEYVSVINDFDSSTLPALTTRTGDLTIKKLKAYGSDTNKDYTITCSIVASPVERDSQASGEVSIPATQIVRIGDVISLAGENFNVIGIDDTSVTLFARYNLGTNYRQTEDKNYVSFSDTNGWSTDSPSDVYIQSYSGNAKTYVNSYVSFLRSQLGITNVYGDLITLKQLKGLGCDVTDDYSMTMDGMRCNNSANLYFLENSQNWWTRSVFSSEYIYYGVPGVSFNYGYDYGYSYPSAGIRPVITIPINVARENVYRWYDVGEEINIGDEYFNVISDNGDTITMLAQYNLGSNYKQSTEINGMGFTDGEHSWEYTPGPKEIDVQTWAVAPKNYINEYVSYLSQFLGTTDLSGDLITLNRLGKLGCTFPEDYSYDIGSCSSSPYIDWLFNGQKWWTRSAQSDDSDRYIWMVDETDGLYSTHYGNYFVGVRPIITISKEYLYK